MFDKLIIILLIFFSANVYCKEWSYSEIRATGKNTLSMAGFYSRCGEMNLVSANPKAIRHSFLSGQKYLIVTGIHSEAIDWFENGTKGLLIVDPSISEKTKKVKFTINLCSTVKNVLDNKFHIVNSYINGCHNPDKATKECFVNIKLPKQTSIELPKNWVILSGKKRVNLNNIAASTFDFNREIFSKSKLPFAANYYKNKKTVGMVNVRFYEDDNMSQEKVKQLKQDDIKLIDSYLEKEVISKFKKKGVEITKWNNTKKSIIHGHYVLISEYHRKSNKKKAIFRVRLIRVLNAKKSFTLTVSYSENESQDLEKVTDRIISSLKMYSYKKRNESNRID